MLAAASRLREAEAIELGYALVGRVAAMSRVRALAIKGFAHSHHGLRGPRIPSDVDVLVDPGAADALATALESRGWVGAAVLAEKHTFIGHARTFWHELWPITIDVHHWFPGFLESPQVVFDALWESRDSMTAAGHSVDISGHAGSVLILALHSLRTFSSGMARLDLKSLVARSAEFSPAQRLAIAELAAATGCSFTLEPELRRMGIVPVSSDGQSEVESLREWRILVDSGFAPADLWLSQFWGARWRDRPRIALRALWPPSAELRVMHPEIGDGRAREIGARLARWGRALRAVPRAIAHRIRRRRHRAS